MDFTTTDRTRPAKPVHILVSCARMETLVSRATPSITASSIISLLFATAPQAITRIQRPKLVFNVTFPASLALTVRLAHRATQISSGSSMLRTSAPVFPSDFSIL